MTRLVIASVLIMAAAPAFAQTIPAQAPKAQPVASTDKSDANRIVCKTEKVIGTRLGGKKVCLTVKEWQERASVGREETDRVQRDSQLGTPSG